MEDKKIRGQVKRGSKEVTEIIRDLMHISDIKRKVVYVYI